MLKNLLVLLGRLLGSGVKRQPSTAFGITETSLGLIAARSTVFSRLYSYKRTLLQWTWLPGDSNRKFCYILKFTWCAIRRLND